MRIKDATSEHIQRISEFIYLQNMHICGNYKQYYPLKYTPLYNTKQAGKLHLDRSSGKLFPNAKYGAAIF